MRSEGKQPERRREILEAALRVFSERGFAGASIRRISEEAGLNSPPLVYWYFESKQALFAETLAHFSERVSGFAFGDALERAPEDLLPELARVELWDFEDGALVRLLRMAVAESALNPASSERFFVVFRGEAMDFLTRYLERWAPRSGTRNFHPRTEARAFFGALFFYALNREVFPGFGGELPDPDVYADAVAQRVLDRLVIPDQRDPTRPKALVHGPPPVRNSLDSPDRHRGEEGLSDVEPAEDVGGTESGNGGDEETAVPSDELSRSARKGLEAQGVPSEAGTVEAGLDDEHSDGLPPWVARGERLRDLEAHRVSEREGLEPPTPSGGPFEPAESVEGMERRESSAETYTGQDALSGDGVRTSRASGIGRERAPASGQPFPAEPPAPSERMAPRGSSEGRGVGGVRKVLFFVLPVRGHVEAALPIARELASRGEEVVFYTVEEFEGLVRGAGTGFRVLDDEFALPEELSGGYFGASRDLRPSIIRSIADSLRGVGRLAGWVEQEGADYAVYDPLCPWGRLIPEALGLPLVALYPTFVARESSPLARRLLPNLEGAPPPALVMPMVRLRWELREARSALGLSRLRPADLLLRSADLNIVTLPERFQPTTGGTLDDGFVFVGSSILRRDEQTHFSLERIEAQPTVFISLGAASGTSIAELYRACVETFASSRWLVVIETGAGTDPALLGETPPNVIVQSRVLRLEVLRRCDVFVTDGDVGATMEALWFGVPLVVVPRTPEQDVMAERVRELQLGTVLDSKATGADALREAVDAVGTDPSRYDGLADLWVAARHAGGHRLAADEIQSFIDRAFASPADAMGPPRTSQEGNP